RPNAIYTTEGIAQVLIVGNSLHPLHFSSRHAAMRYRLRRFSLACRSTNSFFFLDLSALNGL
ncbi:hypothetical protein ABTE83_19865, partial [Acinetobacter baumannii]